MNTDKIFEFLKEGMTADLVNMLIEKLDMTIEEALDALFTSETFSRLSVKETGFYFQSPKYVFTFLEDELKHGHFIPEAM